MDRTILLRNFQKQSPKGVLIKLQAEGCNFITGETMAQVFSCEFCEISKNPFFIKHLRATASELFLYDSVYCTPCISKHLWFLFRYYINIVNNANVFDRIPIRYLQYQKTLFYRFYYEILVQSQKRIKKRSEICSKLAIKTPERSQ